MRMVGQLGGWNGPFEPNDRPLAGQNVGDGCHFIAHAGTSPAIFALDACGALDESRAELER
jgi:hypothetical protein